ncbi:MAG TPA: deoxyhypusine synthase family protein [Longimicrobiales bacterium]
MTRHFRHFNAATLVDAARAWREHLDNGGKTPVSIAGAMSTGREDVPPWGCFCQLSDSTTSYGSHSGAVPNEKITWGKLNVETPKFMIESDASIVAPLIFAYVLGW